MGFPWLDGLIIVIVVGLVLWELRRDLGQSLFDTIALVLGLRLALWLGPSLSHSFHFASARQACGLGLLTAFLIASAACLALGYYLYTLTRWTMDWFDKVAGVLLGFTSAVIICHVLVTSLTLMFATHSGPPVFVTHSLLGEEALSFRTFQQLMQFFNGLRTWG